MDVIFIVRQIAEKAIEYDKPTFMCFVDLTKAFDRVRLTIRDVADILRGEDTPEEIVQVIESLNFNTTTQIRVNNSLTEEVPIITGIRQGDSLSPQLFNLVIHKIIAEVKKAGRRYRTHKGELTVLCYTDDAVLISENFKDYSASFI